MQDDLSARDFGAAFKGFLEQAATGVEAEEPIFARRLRQHLGVDPSTLEIVSRGFEAVDRPNLQVALDAYLAGEGRGAETIGFVSPYAGFRSTSITELIAQPRAGFFSDGAGVQEGPVEYAEVELGEGRSLTCIDSALLLVATRDGPLALLISSGQEQMPFRGRIELQAMAPERELAESFLTELKAETRARNVYRGRVISLEQESFGSLKIKFHELPSVDRERIILPQGVLERIEAHTIVFARHAERLREARRHLRRGLLLHGPPGTGKTMTAMYVVGQLPGRTVLLLTGGGLGLVEQSVQFARMLEPSLVVLEDVDLVAEERTRQHMGQNAVLFELLNQMDGLTEDADIIFLLTTNRPDLLEPALAARPGRIDQAIEIPLPDAACRRLLFDLYAEGLQLEVVELDRLVERTRGVSAAFIRELLRKAALFAADENGAGPLVVRGSHLDEALHDLVIEGGELTKTLLGGSPPPVT
jgi:hypothetical protein